MTQPVKKEWNIRINAKTSRMILVNTLAVYFRSIFSAVLALLSSRWVLQALGQTDFGLYNVIGSVIILFTFINSILASSVARFLAFATGEGSASEVGEWFNAAFGVHLAIATLLAMAALLGGENFIRHVLNIPPEKLESCVSIFQISLVSAFVSMVTVPYVSMINARQKITELAGWGILQSILSFSLAWSLRYLSSGRLFIYAVGVCLIVIVIQAILVLRARSLFPECKLVPGQWVVGRKTCEIFRFASLNIFGGLGSIGRDQGSALMLNKFFGPNINAAYGLATLVGTQANQLSLSMINAFSPEIAASEGRGEHAKMLALSFQANKLSSVLIAFFAIPLIFECEFLLGLWLTEVPPLTVPFVRLLLITFMIDRLGTGYTLAINASGKIGAMQISMGAILLLSLPVSYVLFRCGLPPTAIASVFIVSIIMLLGTRVVLGKALLGIPCMSWMREVLCPSLAVITASCVSVLLVSAIMPASLARLALSFLVGTAVNLGMTYLLILGDAEKRKLREKLGRLLVR